MEDLMNCVCLSLSNITVESSSLNLWIYVTIFLHITTYMYFEIMEIITDE